MTVHFKRGVGPIDNGTLENINNNLKDYVVFLAFKVLNYVNLFSASEERNMNDFIDFKRTEQVSSCMGNCKC